MATIYTKTTELSVAFGLLETHPSESTYDYIADKFAETLDQATYDNIIAEFGNLKKAKNAKTYEELWTVGREIRSSYLKGRHISKVEWIGPHKQRKSVSVSKDLCIDDHIYISVKATSNVVFNHSPYNLLQALPSGSPMATNETHWFSQIAPGEYDELYQFVKNNFPGNLQLPSTVSDFDKSVSKKVKKEIQGWLNNMDNVRKSKFESLYLDMCHAVAERSSEVFMENRRNVNKRQLNTANELILKSFLRLNSAPYLLAGLDGDKPFAVEVPDITRWFQYWNFAEIEAKGDIDRAQSVVNFLLKLINRQTNEVIELPYHAEIRWSHGKFCGNPEGKLYKDFKWSDVPFFKKVI